MCKLIIYIYIKSVYHVTVGLSQSWLLSFARVQNVTGLVAAIDVFEARCETSRGEQIIWVAFTDRSLSHK